MRQTLLTFICLLGLSISANAEEAKSKAIVFHRLQENQPLILFPVKLDGTSHTFVLDTGAANHVFGSHLMPFIKGETRSYPHPRKQIRVCPPQNISVQGVHDSVSCESYILDLRDVSHGGRTPIDGILGIPFLHHRTLELDFEQQIVRVLDGPSGQHGETFPLKFDRLARPWVTDVNLAEQNPPFLIDTGMIDAIAVKADLFNNLHERNLLSDVQTVNTLGIEGLTDRRVGRLESVYVGPYRLSGVPVRESSTNKIGLAVLRHFHVTIDFANAKLKLAKNASFGERINMPQSVVLPKSSSPQ